MLNALCNAKILPNAVDWGNSRNPGKCVEVNAVISCNLVLFSYQKPVGLYESMLLISFQRSYPRSGLRMSETNCTSLNWENSISTLTSAMQEYQSVLVIYWRDLWLNCNRWRNITKEEGKTGTVWASDTNGVRFSVSGALVRGTWTFFSFFKVYGKVQTAMHSG